MWPDYRLARSLNIPCSGEWREVSGLNDAVRLGVLRRTSYRNNVAEMKKPGRTRLFQLAKKQSGATTRDKTDQAQPGQDQGVGFGFWNGDRC